VDDLTSIKSTWVISVKTKFKGKNLSINPQLAQLIVQTLIFVLIHQDKNIRYEQKTFDLNNTYWFFHYVNS